MLKNQEEQVLRPSIDQHLTDYSNSQPYRPAPNRLGQQHPTQHHRDGSLTALGCTGWSITQEPGSFRNRELKRTAPLPTQSPVCTEWSSVREWFPCLGHFCKIQTTAGKEEKIHRSHTWHIYCQTNLKLADS